MDASVSEIRALSGADVREIRQIIQASESNRQAAARSINTPIMDKDAWVGRQHRSRDAPSGDK